MPPPTRPALRSVPRLRDPAKPPLPAPAGEGRAPSSAGRPAAGQGQSRPAEGRGRSPSPRAGRPGERLRSPAVSGEVGKARKGLPRPRRHRPPSARLPRRRGGCEPRLSAAAPRQPPLPRLSAASPRSPLPDRNRRRVPAALETPSSAGTCPCRSGRSLAQPLEQEGETGTGRGLRKGLGLEALPRVQGKRLPPATGTAGQGKTVPSGAEGPCPSNPPQPPHQDGTGRQRGGSSCSPQ